MSSITPNSQTASLSEASLDTLFDNTESWANERDAQDPLSLYRQQFYIPCTKEGGESIYLAGNSLGLQPRTVKQFIDQELLDWAKLGVEGHFSAKNPWLSYHENLTAATAALVGAKPSEVVVMNSLTANLHLMLVSFYTPRAGRFKILVENSPFPSDRYAVASQVKFHGFDPKEVIVELKPQAKEDTLRTEDIVSFIKKNGGSIALVLLGHANYLTGQAFDIAAIAEAAHEQGCFLGLSLAHGVGNLILSLHDWGVDFAVWCCYKYLNAGPGAVAGCFVHEKHAFEPELNRWAGWWGHNKQTRFQMGSEHDPIPGAEGWQLSNPPIFQLAALWASLQIFDKATMTAIRKKSELLTGYLEFLLGKLPYEFITTITPRNKEERGCQLSLRVKGQPQELVKELKVRGVVCDFREPDIIRAAPVPLYNSFTEVYRFAKLLEQYAK